MKNTVVQLPANGKLMAALFLAASFVIVAAGNYFWRNGSPLTSPSSPIVQSGEAALDQLKKDGSYDSLAAAMAAARYQINRDGDRVLAENPAQQFSANFSGKEIRIVHTQSSKVTSQFGLQLLGYKYGDQRLEIGTGDIAISGNRVEIHKPGITEWYVNQPEGLEQGFTLHAPLAFNRASVMTNHRLQLEMQVTGDLRAEATNPHAISFSDSHGRVVLAYDHLAAWDANHNSLPATISANGQVITLEVDDANAVYPVTIDPLIAQQTKFTAADGAANDQFGTSVSVSGDYAVIGAPEDDAQRGAAYVFVRSGAAWSQQAKLVAVDGAAADRFGISVSISGPTVVVGASGADFEGNVNHGAAYVFVRNGATWSQQAKTAVSDGSQVAAFGYSVSISGDTALIGTPSYGLGNETGRGAVYVYKQAGVTWTLQQKLLAGDGAAGDNLGYSVALDGNTALLGAEHAKVGGNSAQGAAYVFTYSNGMWTQQAKLTANDGAANDQFAWAVALSGDTVVIGSRLDDIGAASNQGSAYVFVRSGGIWSQQQKLLAADGGVADAFGYSVGISGDLIVVGSTDYDLVGYQNQGSVYLFSRTSGVWSQRQKLRAADGAEYDYLGSSVAISNNTIVSGAYKADVNGNQDQGAAYAFAVVGDVAQAQKFSAADGKLNSEFGNSVAISGKTAVVGAHFDTIGANWPGSAYVFVNNGSTWTLQQKLTASDGASSDQFGQVVAISGDTVLVGAFFKANGVATQQGAAYVFVRTNGVWTQQQKLLAADGVASDRFGASVALNGNTAMIGASSAQIGGNSQQGAVYVFTRNGATWSQQQKLTAANATGVRFFGSAVAMSGYAAIIGSTGDTINGASGRGSAYIFTNSGGATWSEQQRLTALDGAANHQFGTCVALDGPTALVGSYQNGSGAAYVFTYNGATWNQQQELFPSDPASDTYFGTAVALSGELAMVGAQKWDSVPFQNQGAAYLFERTGAVWTQRQKLLASDAATEDRFGYAVAIAGPEMLVGAPSDDLAQANQGSVYFFRYTTCPTIILNATPPNGTVGVSYNQQLSATGAVGPYQYSLSGGALPAGLSLSSSGLLSGTPTTAGTFSFTVTAMVASLCSGSQTYTVTIASNCQAITVNPITVSDATLNQFYTQTFTQTGAVLPVTLTLVGTLPNGLTYNQATATLSGTPTQLGSFNFTVTATGFDGCQGVRNYSLTVYSMGISATDLQFYPLAHPVRLLDTRVGQTGCDSPAAKITGGTSRTQTAAGRTCDGLTIPANAAALVGNATSVQSGGGYFTLYPSDIAKPNSANSNYSANQILNSLFTVRLGANDGAFKIFVSTDTDIVVDITGYYAPPTLTGLYFHPLPKPVRLLDTRAGASACYTPGLPIQANTERTQIGTTTCDNVLIPAGALALTGNATTVSPQANGFLTLYPADAARPLIASANFQPGVNLNSPFMVGLSPSGEFNIYVASTTDLVVDVTGYYSTQLNDSNGQGLLFNALSGPVRLLDTRAGQTGCYTPGMPMVGGSPYSQPAIGACTSVSGSAQAVVGNATTLNAAANGYLTFWPSDANQPFIATSNYRTGITFNRHFTTGLGADGAFKRFALSTTDLIVDVVGYFAP